MFLDVETKILINSLGARYHVPLIQQNFVATDVIITNIRDRHWKKYK